MKTFVYVGTSIDGFIAGKDGDINWLTKFESREITDSFNKFINMIDVAVIGKGTFEKVLSFPDWPYNIMVYVLSRSIKQLPESLKGKAKIISMEPKEILNYLSAEGYTNIYVDGGMVIQEFLRGDYIDEMIITRAPVLLGSGIPLFGLLENEINFTHSETIVYSNGLIKSSYRRIQIGKGNITNEH